VIESLDQVRYATPKDVDRVLADRIALAETTLPYSVAKLRRQFVYDRLLTRCFSTHPSAGCSRGHESSRPDTRSVSAEGMRDPWHTVLAEFPGVEVVVRDAGTSSPASHSGRLIGVVDKTKMWPYNGRTVLESVMTSGPQRKRNARIEVRATTEDRELIERAVAASETDLTQFVVSNLTMAARRVLADRTEFSLDSESLRAWEEVNECPARDLVGLRELMQRPSPFVDV